MKQSGVGIVAAVIVLSLAVALAAQFNLFGLRPYLESVLKPKAELPLEVKIETYPVKEEAIPQYRLPFPAEVDSVEYTFEGDVEVSRRICKPYPIILWTEDHRRMETDYSTWGEAPATFTCDHSVTELDKPLPDSGGATTPFGPGPLEPPLPPHGQ